MIVAGAVLVLGQLLHDHPEHDAAATDRVTGDLLRMLALLHDDAHERNLVARR